MKKDFSRMPRVLSIIAGVMLLLNCLGMAITVISQTGSMLDEFLNYSIGFDNPMFAYSFWITVETAFTMLFMILTAVMLLRGKKDLFAGLAFCATAVYWVADAAFNIVVIHPAGVQIDFSTREYLIFTVCCTLLLAVLWVIATLVCLTKDKLKPLFFLPLLVALVYIVYSTVSDLSFSIDSLISMYSDSSQAMSIFDVIRTSPLVLVELLLETVLYGLNLVPELLFALACSIPGRAKQPKPKKAKKPIPTYKPAKPAAPVKPAPEKKLPTYVPPRADSLEQQLRNLKNLREKDLISQEEYDAKRKKLLNL